MYNVNTNGLIFGRRMTGSTRIEVERKTAIRRTLMKRAQNNFRQNCAALQSIEMHVFRDTVEDNAYFLQKNFTI